MKKWMNIEKWKVIIIGFTDTSSANVKNDNDKVKSTVSFILFKISSIQYFIQFPALLVIVNWQFQVKVKQHGIGFMIPKLNFNWFRLSGIAWVTWLGLFAVDTGSPTDRRI